MTADNSSVADVYQSLKAVLDIFKVNAPESVDVPSKQVLVQAAEQIKSDAAKIGLMCSGGAPPKDQQVSLATALQRSCIAFVTVCHASTAAAGPSLKDSLVKLAQDMVNPCLALIRDMGSGKDLKNHIGLIWERVGSVLKAPTDNKACLFAALTKVMSVMKDTIREMEELQDEQEEEYGTPEQPQPSTSTATGDAADAATASAANGSAQREPPAAAAAGAGGNATITSEQHQREEVQQQDAVSSSNNASKPRAAAANVDLDFEADEMSYWERQLLTASIALLQAAAAVVKAFGKALLQGPALQSGSDVLDSWESCLWHSKHLRRAVEDLGAAMYPPQDFEEVGGASLAVFEVTELMSDECPDPEAVGAEQLSKLNQQLLSAHEEVERLLKEAQAHEQQQQQQQQQQQEP